MARTWKSRLRMQPRSLLLAILVVAAIGAGGVAAADVVAPRFWALIMQAEYLDQAGVRRQTSASDCGVAALEMVLVANDLPAALNAARARARSSGRGLTLAEMRTLAGESGLRAEGYHVEDAGLSRLPTPFIAHFPRHYVVVDLVTDDMVEFRDPAVGRLRANRTRFHQLWSGHVLLAAAPTPRKVYNLLWQ